jgi:hypothetical protein
MSAKHSKPAKPERPSGSPLFWHARGRWAKKIKGSFVYFGRGSHDDALAGYNERKDELHSGKVRRDDPESLTVYQLAAKFLVAKMAQRDNGELAHRSFVEYGAITKRAVKVLGRNRLVSDLTPADFSTLRTKGRSARQVNVHHLQAWFLCRPRRQPGALARDEEYP